MIYSRNFSIVINKPQTCWESHMIFEQLVIGSSENEELFVSEDGKKRILGICL